MKISLPIMLVICCIASTVNAEWQVYKEYRQSSGHKFCNMINKPLAFMVLGGDKGQASAILTVLDDLYPGSYVYFNINGRRFSNEKVLRVNKAIFDSLSAETEAHMGWSPWPSGSREATVSLVGFKQAFSECSEYFGDKVHFGP